MTATNPMQQPVQRLGKFRLLATIAHGGMADVYLAASDGIGGFTKLQVVKRLRDQHNPEAIEMFLSEARLAAKLNHPNIVQTTEINEDQGQYFMVMEYLEGPAMSRFRKRATEQERLTVPVAVALICGVLDGLHAAHEAKDHNGKLLNIVHRDLSPHNVIVTTAGIPKLLDFGIAKSSEVDSVTKTGYFKGKLAYMPPEQARAEQVDKRADLFSAAVTFVELLTGKSFWPDPSDVAISSRLLSANIPVPELPDSVSDAMKAVIAKGAAVRPEDRFESAAAMRRAIEAAASSSGGKASTEEVGKLVRTLFEREMSDVRGMTETRLKATATDELQSVPRTPVPLPQFSNPGTGTQRSAQSSSQSSIPSRLTPSMVLGEPKVSLALVVGIGSAAIIILLAAIAFWLGKSSNAPLAEPTSASRSRTLEATPEAPNAVLPPQKFTSVELSVTPNDARISIDGLEVATGHLSARYAQDKVTHQLRFSAPGFVDHQELVRFDKEVVSLPTVLLRAENVRPSPEPSPRPVAAVPRRVVARPKAPVAASKPSPPPAETTAVPAESATGPKRKELDTDVFEKAKKTREVDDPWKN
jgi:eukaryotic-like serine/threonine-protein kinase